MGATLDAAPAPRRAPHAPLTRAKYARIVATVSLGCILEWCAARLARGPGVRGEGPGRDRPAGRAGARRARRAGAVQPRGAPPQTLAHARRPFAHQV
jgi:hypothetical protein